MKNITYQLIYFALVVTVISACSIPEHVSEPKTLEVPAHRGRVIDITTGNGVPNILVVTYYSLNLGYTGWGCVGDQYSTTDSQGYFTAPAQTLEYHGKPTPSGPGILFHGPGWMYQGLRFDDRTSDPDLGTEILVKPDDRDTWHRSNDVLAFANNSRKCVAYSDQQQLFQYYNLLRVLYADAVIVAGGNSNSSEEELLELSLNNNAVGGIYSAARDVLKRLGITLKPESLPAITAEDINKAEDDGK